MISNAEGYDLFRWDCNRGLCDITTSRDAQGTQVKSANNDVHEFPRAALDHILAEAKSDNQKMRSEHMVDDGHVFCLLDFHLFLRSDAAPALQRQFKEFSEISSVCYIIVIAPVFECPVTLQKHITVIDFPYPSYDELKVVLFNVKKDIQVKFIKASRDAEEKEEDILKSAAGMTMIEAENAFALTLVKKKTFDIPSIIREKRQIIRKEGLIDFRTPRYSFDLVGGLDTLKEWFRKRRLAFSEQAREYGLENPKGALLVGIPGTGKSLSCDALANYWEMPLLRLDMGVVFSSHVGESEANIRKVISLAEAVSPCVLWIDEIEKGIGGIQSSNRTDGGVTNRVFSSFLTWMQEKQAPVFTICTANNVLEMPPEFMRAGRFDEIFFLDLPTLQQREEVTRCLLRKKKRDPASFDVFTIAKKTEHYTPAEIEKAINNGLFTAYADGQREVTTEDILDEATKFEPLYNSRYEEIEELRNWALGEKKLGGNAILANSTTATEQKKAVGDNYRGRQIDMSEVDEPEI